MAFNPAQGDGAQLMDIMQLQATLNGYSLVDPSEAAVTPGSTALTVDVAAAPSGVRLGGPAESFVGANGIALPTPDANNPRKALVYLDSTGSVQTLGGDPATPVPSGEIRTKTGVPTLPIPADDFLPLAEVWIPAEASDTVSNDISSRRMAFSQGDGSGLNADLVRGDDPVTSYTQLTDVPTETQPTSRFGGYVTEFNDSQQVTNQTDSGTTLSANESFSFTYFRDEVSISLDSSHSIYSPNGLIYYDYENTVEYTVYREDGSTSYSDSQTDQGSDSAVNAGTTVGGSASVSLDELDNPENIRQIDIDVLATLSVQSGYTDEPYDYDLSISADVETHEEAVGYHIHGTN